MTGIVIVLISVVAAAYLIIKKFYAPGALLLVGLITLAVVAVISPDPLVTGKKATHLAGLDVIQIMTNLLQSRAAGLGMNIMVIGGFASYMNRIGAAGALVRLSVKPLSYFRSPYVVMALGTLISITLTVSCRLSTVADGVDVSDPFGCRSFPTISRRLYCDERMLVLRPLWSQ